MTPRTLNTLLWTGAVTCVAGAALAVAVAVISPVNDVAPRSEHLRGAFATTRAVESSAAQFVLDDVWSRPLRAPLGDELVLTSHPPPSQPATGMPQITLLGTIGHSVALLETAGAVEAASVGDTVSGAQVLTIRPANVQLRYNDQLFTLTKPAEDSGP